MFAKPQSYFLAQIQPHPEALGDTRPDLHPYRLVWQSP